MALCGSRINAGGRGGQSVQRASDKSRVKLGGSPTYNGEPPHIKRRSTAVIDQMPSLSPVFSLFSLYHRQEIPAKINPAKNMEVLIFQC